MLAHISTWTLAWHALLMLIACIARSKRGALGALISRTILLHMLCMAVLLTTRAACATLWVRVASFLVKGTVLVVLLWQFWDVLEFSAWAAATSSLIAVAYVCVVDLCRAYGCVVSWHELLAAYALAAVTYSALMYGHRSANDDDARKGGARPLACHRAAVET